MTQILLNYTGQACNHTRNIARGERAPGNHCHRSTEIAEAVIPACY
jgi:hypothetical protein